MLRYEGGATVRSGLYWDPAKWEMVTIPREGGVLPATARTYVKAPLLALLVLAPVMGGLYVVFLPFIGFAVLLGFAARRAWRGLREGAAGLVAMVAARPAEANARPDGGSGNGTADQAQRPGAGGTARRGSR